MEVDCNVFLILYGLIIQYNYFSSSLVFYSCFNCIV